MQITVLSGGVDGARFVQGLVNTLADRQQNARIKVISNTGDDITHFGLRVCPDLDGLLYALGGEVDEAGSGRADDTHHAATELAALGVEPQWARLGDRDLATHLARTLWLSQGMTLSQVTERLAQRWGLPDQGVHLLPVTDSPIETHVVVEEPDGGHRAIHARQWLLKHQAAIPAQQFTVAGLTSARPAPGVLEAILEADVVLLSPGNPVLSLGIILGIPGVRDSLRGTRAPVVGVTPVRAGQAVPDHLRAALDATGISVDPAGVATLYADFLSGWLVHVDDTALGYPRGVRVSGLTELPPDNTPSSWSAMASAALELAHDLIAEAPGNSA